MNNKLWYTILKGGLVTHLRDTARSNEDASERQESEGSDPPSNSRCCPKRQNLHPISVALGAVKREQLDNLVHARTKVHEVRSHRMNAFELTLIACL